MTSKPICPRCRANALGSRIDSARDADAEIVIGGSTNYYHTAECGRHPQVPERLRPKVHAASVLRDMPVAPLPRNAPAYPSDHATRAAGVMAEALRVARQQPADKTESVMYVHDEIVVETLAESTPGPALVVSGIDEAAQVLARGRVKTVECRIKLPPDEPAAPPPSEAQVLLQACRAAHLQPTRENSDALLDAICGLLGCTTVDEMERARVMWDPRNRMVCIGAAELERLARALHSGGVG